MRTRHLLASASVVALLLSACGGDDTTKTSSSTSTTKDDGGKAFDQTSDTIGGGDDAAPSGDAPEDCKVGSGDAGALEPLMPTGPAGFDQQADDVGDTGPSDFDKAVADDSLDDAAQVLTEAGFLAGYQRYWIRNDEDDLIAFLYEFCDEAGAQHYLERNLTEDDSGPGVTDFTPAGLDAGYAKSGSDEGYTAAQVALVHDHYLVMTVAGSTESTDKAPFEALATDLAKAMVGELAAG